jgi:hypothetical protein
MNGTPVLVIDGVEYGLYDGTLDGILLGMDDGILDGTLDGL